MRSTTSSKGWTLGHYLGARLSEAGVSDAFIVPGDFNMKLLDEMMLAEPKLRQIGCCNELNAGYAADGYARGKGLGALVVTHMVGALSALNAIAGSYAEQSPVVCVVGTLNTNDINGPRMIHHTLGNRDSAYQHIAFRSFVCHQVLIKSIEDAAVAIDTAVRAAMVHRQPVVIEVPCNLASATHASLALPLTPMSLQLPHSNRHSLKAAVAAVADQLESAKKVVIVAGPLLGPYKGVKPLQAMAEAIGCPVVVAFDGKGAFPEAHPLFVGVLWGEISSPGVADYVRSADVILSAGYLGNDMETAGFKLRLPNDVTVKIGANTVSVCGGQCFNDVQMADFLEELALALEPRKPLIPFSIATGQPNGQTNGQTNGSCNGEGQALSLTKGTGSTSSDVSEPPDPSGPSRYSAPYFEFSAAEDANAPLTTNALYYRIQGALNKDTIVVTDCGDSIFQVAKLKLPAGCGMEMQVQYASIGWSVGATLGLSLAYQPAGRRVFAVIGDGAFQMAAQEVSTMMRSGVNPLIFVLNNGIYGIEEMIHTGDYNRLKVWDYALLAKALSNGDGCVFSATVKTEADLVAALLEATGPSCDKLCLLDVQLAADDCSDEMLRFGKILGAFGSRPPAQD